METKVNKAIAVHESRMCDITDEFLAGLQDGKHHQEFWYDRSHRGLTCRRFYGKTDMFYLVAQKYRAAAVKLGKYLPRQIKLLMPVEQARAFADEKNREYEEIYRQSKLIGKKVKSPRPTNSSIKRLLEKPETSDNPNYDALLSVLMDAYDQAANGKGADRHGRGLNFEDQDMLTIMDNVGIGFGAGQAIKKIVEGIRLNDVQCRKELLGAIVYLAGTILWVNKHDRGTDTGTN